VEPPSTVKKALASPIGAEELARELDGEGDPARGKAAVQALRDAFFGEGREGFLKLVSAVGRALGQPPT
jgi:hypothetical protein